MIRWDKRLLQLNDALAFLIPFPHTALTILERAKINYTFIDFSGSPLTMWNSIMRYVVNNQQLSLLVDAVLEQYPANPYLLAYKEATFQDYTPGPDINMLGWKARLDERTKEKIMGAESTLLPVKFLAQGIIASRSVVRIRVPGDDKDELGSGFLVAGNILITNNHVLPDPAAAEKAEIAFDYEESVTGIAVTPTFTSLLPAEYFRTSENEDWTAVRVEGDQNAKFGALKLYRGSLRAGDFVNIIQHPGGRYKQIALYHNIVTYEDDNIVQYLTDTEPGSSGSPVFNSKWEVVALHHSGGVMLEPNIPQKMLRNEGVNIARIIAGLNH